MAVSPNDAKAELAWRKWKRDVCWAAENGWHIEHPQGHRAFELRDPQKDALTRWAGGENSITLKARQIGWSTCVGFYAAWLAMSNPQTKILFLSKGERESKLLLDKVKFGLDKMPDWLAHKAPKVKRSNMEIVEWDNGSSVMSLPSRNNPARGFTGRLVVVDEWAFLENGDEAWASIEPVTDIGGQVIGLSTANGVGNTFHDLWLRAKSGNSSFKPMFYSWRAVPERDDAWYEAKRHDMQTWQLHQEYPTTPEEAFIKSGAMVFDPDVLDWVKGQFVRPPEFRGDLSYVDGLYRFPPSDTGPMKVWEKPQPHAVYAIGADVAEGLEHGDYSSAHVIKITRHAEDVVRWQVVACWHGHVEPDIFADILNDIGRWYNEALIGVEANNHGNSTVTQLRRGHNYPRLYRERKVDHRRKQRTQRLGWWTDKKSKPIAIDDLRQSLRENLELHDMATLDELYTFVYDGKGGMEGSPHDDRVMSLAIATQMAPRVFHKDYKVEKVVGPNSIDWWVQKLEESQGLLENPDFVIGAQRQTRAG